MATARFIVYELADPRTDRPFYIGKGLPSRLGTHVPEARRWIADGRPTKGKWHSKNLAKLRVLADLLAAGLSPVVRVVAEFDNSEQAALEESTRIAAAPSGSLTNKTAGGEHGGMSAYAARCGKPQARLNYSLSSQTARALADYCESTGRKAAEVARQVILDYLETDDSSTLAPCVNHPSEKRADLWVHPMTLESVDRRVKQERHVSRSAMIDKLLSSFLTSRPVPKVVTVTINVPVALWNRLGENKEAAIISAIEDSIEDKELIRA